ncbi:MAG: NAD(P)-binding domain-containing protein [Candidatus Thorarchaeota archaeon]
MNTKVGFIGIGNMGRPMAKRLLGANYDLHVFDANREQMDNLELLGAKKAESVQDLALLSDVIFLCLPNSRVVEMVALGKNGILEWARNGSVVIDMTTAYPPSTLRISEELEARGIEMLDAPVSGGPFGVEAGTLSMIVGGKRETFERSRHILKAIAPKNLSYIGQIGWGHTTKAINNFLAAVQRWISTEAMALVTKAGIIPAKALKIMQASPARNFNIEVVYPKFILPKERQGYTTGLMHKDLEIMNEMSLHMDIFTPMASFVRSLFEFMVLLEGPDQEINQHVRFIEDWGKVQIRPSSFHESRLGEAQLSEKMGMPRDMATQEGHRKAKSIINRKIGFIGLNHITQFIAMRLSNGDWSLIIHDPHGKSIQPVNGNKVEKTNDIKDLIIHCDLIIIGMNNVDEVNDIILGKSGLFDSAKTETVFMLVSPGSKGIKQDLLCRMQQESVEMLNTTIFHEMQNQENDSLLLIATGRRETFEALRPVLSAISPEMVHYVGNIKCAEALRCAINTISLTNTWAVFEAIGMAKKSGLPIEKLLQIINQSTGRSYQTEIDVPRYITKTKTDNGTTLGQACRAIDTACGLAAELELPFLLGKKTRELFHYATVKVDPLKDLSVLLNLIIG